MINYTRISTKIGYTGTDFIDGKITVLSEAVDDVLKIKGVGFRTVEEEILKDGQSFILLKDELERLAIKDLNRQRNRKMAANFKYYKKKGLQPMRPYILGEDLTGVSVNKEDTPEEGGMIAMNPKNPEDRWYVAKKFFEDNYEEAQ